jgi:hypothetical protein
VKLDGIGSHVLFPFEHEDRWAPSRTAHFLVERMDPRSTAAGVPVGCTSNG